MNSDFVLGPIKSVVILGGGELVIEILRVARRKNLKTRVITSSRYIQKQIDGSSLVDYLQSSGIDFLVAENIEDSEVKQFIEGLEGPLFLSVGAPWIFSKSVLENLFDNKLLNIHGTRLPQNRGGGGFSWQILMDYRFGACLIHRVTTGIDTGEIIDYQEFIYPATARIPLDFERIYIKKNTEFISSFFDKYLVEAKHINLFKQTEYLSSYWPRLNTAANAFIDWSLTPEEIERFICAFDRPYSGASTILGDQLVRIRSVQLTTGDGPFHPYQTGLIYKVSGDYCLVALKERTLIVEEILDANNKNILPTVKVGSRLKTSSDMKYNSLIRPQYGPSGLIT